MNAIVTPGSLEKIRELDEPLTSSSLVFFLYEPNEAVSVEDMAAIYDSKAKLVFLKVASRDDKLLCIGGIKTRTDCVILDDELQCSLDFLQKVNSVFPQGSMTVGGEYVTSAGSVRPRSFSETITAPEMVPKSKASVKPGQGMNAIQRARKVSEQQMQQSAVKNNGNILTQKSQALFDIIKVTGADVGFSLGTEALMQAIASAVARSGNDDEALQESIEDITGGVAIWKRMLPRLSAIRQVVLDN